MDLSDKGVILIISTQRSGSTYLFDLIRYHPSIEFLYPAVIFKALQLRGNRYPVDLTTEKPFEKSIAVELYWRLQRSGSIRRFATDCLEAMRYKTRHVKALSENSGIKKWVIEKFHPEFYDFNTVRFLSRLEGLSSLVGELKIVLNAREPVAAVGSHLAYQERNSHWYSAFSGSNVFGLYERSLASMTELSKEVDTDYVDYAEIEKSPEVFTGSFYDSIGVANEENQFGILSAEANQRASGGSEKFYGRRPGSKECYGEKYASFFSKNKKSFDALNKHYVELSGSD